MVTIVDLTERDNHRAYKYALLAALLISPPTIKFIQQLEQLATEDSQLLDKTVSDIIAQIKFVKPNITMIEEEFQQLFIGIGEGEVIPYRSWYLSGELMGKSLVALREELQKLGFARQENIHEPEDHIAILCEIMSLLIYNPTEYIFATQRHFFLVYLNSWALHFFHDLHKTPTAQFYRLVGQFGEQFFISEQALFS